MFAFLLYYFITSDLLTRLNPKVSDETVEIAERPEINIKYIYFSIEDLDGKSLYDPSIFTVWSSIQYYKVDDKDPDGLEIYYNDYFEMRLCNELDFGKDLFAERGLRKKFCLSNLTLNLKGYWDENHLKYFYVNLQRCKNSTSNNDSCKSDEEIDEFFRNETYFSVYFLNPFINLGDYLNPIQSVWRTEYKIVDVNITKVMLIHLKKVEFTDDSNFPFISPEFHETYKYDSQENDVQMIPRTETLMSYGFYSSNQITYKKRRF